MNLEISTVFLLFVCCHFTLGISIPYTIIEKTHSDNPDLTFHKISPEDNEEISRICGRTSDRNPRFRVGNGAFAPEGIFPWAGVIENVNGGERLCSMSMISRRHALTVAHCGIRQGEGVYALAYGGNCLIGKPSIVPQSENECNLDNMKRAKVRAVATPDIYDKCNGPRTDITLIELEEDVPLTPDFVPVCLPHVNTQLPSWGAFSGFGLTEDNSDRPQLRYVTGAMGLDQQKGVTLQTADFNDTVGPGAHGLVATSYAKINGGDSGGPLVGWLENDDRAIQFGVCSTGYPNGEQHEITGFPDIRKYSEWICEVTGVCALPIEGERQSAFVIRLIQSERFPIARRIRRMKMHFATYPFRNPGETTVASIENTTLDVDITSESTVNSTEDTCEEQIRKQL